MIEGALSRMSLMKRTTDGEPRVGAVFREIGARQNAERRADREADRGHDHAADDRVEQTSDDSGRGGILGEDVERQSANAVPQQGGQDDREHGQAEGRRRVGKDGPDDVARPAPGIEVGRGRHAFNSRRASMSRAAARTRNVMTNRMKPSASSDDVNSPGSASANWLAIIAEIVVPCARIEA